MTSFATISLDDYKKLVDNEKKNIRSNRKFYNSRNFK